MTRFLVAQTRTEKFKISWLEFRVALLSQNSLFLASPCGFTNFVFSFSFLGYKILCLLLKEKVDLRVDLFILSQDLDLY